MSLQLLREQAAHCKNCDLWECGTQTVFGEGNPHASLMFVGEQPGDREDIEGRPFVGPAGHLFDRALTQAGINRGDVYVTNAVKHFKWQARGKRRIHQKPNTTEVRACHPWLEAEIREVEPEVVVALGATAAQSLLGSKFRLTQHRGEFFDLALGPMITATIHPSAILRADDDDREPQFDAFVADLTRVARPLPTRPLP
jgi:DNA polymerase